MGQILKTSIQARIARGWILLAIILSVVTGCSSNEEIGVVEGVVTYQGKPLSHATLLFRDHERGIHIMADLKDDGSYQVFTAGGKGLPLGEYRVAIMQEGPMLEADSKTGELRRLTTGAGSTVKLPKRYTDVNSSGLTAVVKNGTNRVDFELKE